MGFDITFHPFSRKEYKFYIEQVVERPDDYVEQLKRIHSSSSESDYVAINIYSRFEVFKSNVMAGDESFDSTVGFASASIMGYLHPYWYSRNASLKEVILHLKVESVLSKISSIVELKNKTFFDKAINDIESNYSSGCYIQYEGAKQVMKSIKNKEKYKSLITCFGKDNMASLISCLRYCVKNKLDILESSDIVVPFTGQTTTFSPNFRAAHLKNIKDHKNESKHTFKKKENWIQQILGNTKNR